ncbi:MAG TPA: serine hydrolase domain-containing protein [Puia sp.]|nr:serine hydrolase domain-containing protein [Puia sp.]
MKMFNSRLIWLFVLCVFVLTGKVPAQVIPDSTVKKINDLFEPLNKIYGPGAAVGIVRNDSLIFSKGYGMANLEYTIPNSPETIFHMASVSKQFTAFSIMLLAKQNKLKLDDDIRKYLTWFPNLNEKITIRNLLNHTSGIRDQWQLLAIQGTRLDDVITQEHIIKIISRQQALNFKPGEANSYCNSNFTLLAEIVKSISGQSLRKFTDSTIFKPLGMNNTHFHDDYTEIVKNRSYSYTKKDSTHFENSILSYSNVGATSLFTNVNDMSKWISNFYDHKVGDQVDIDLLTQKTKLRNGKELNYAAGIISDTYKGWRQFSHGGRDAGFRTFITAFPDLRMGVIVFSNVGDYNPTDKALQIASFFITDSTKQITADKEVKKDSAALSKKDSLSLSSYIGSYISEEGIALKLEIKNSRLHYLVGDQSYLMRKDSTGVYSMFYAPNIKFDFNNRSNDKGIVIITPDRNYYLKKYANALLNDKALQAYTGRYYSQELDCSYTIVLKDHHLILTNNKYNDTPLTLAGPDHLLDDFWWMNHLMIKRNKLQQVTGFEVNSDRVMHLAFNKF